ncbi:S8 family peptidase [Pseudodesulfovibrio sp. zrk46]|uniref:S8 family peptidase n=1 Tax=Pseudodesulfovibrio sp. zrk46 TaxID=2725288 RepID=UPI001448BA1D|nr:S8 family peptidase [Pseudodesulfovibrio sp. zrk46]QJB56565.1 S8 family serine peptidase [Pseudodesulfovibrio sp. zrk46]
MKYFLKVLLVVTALFIIPILCHSADTKTPTTKEFARMVSDSADALSKFNTTGLEQTGAGWLVGVTRYGMEQAGMTVWNSELQVLGFGETATFSDYSTILKYEWLPKAGSEDGFLLVTSTCSSEAEDKPSGTVMFKIPVTKKGYEYKVSKPERVVVTSNIGDNPVVSSTVHYTAYGKAMKVPGTMNPPDSTDWLCEECDKLEELLAKYKGKMGELKQERKTAPEKSDMTAYGKDAYDQAIYMLGQDIKNTEARLKECKEACATKRTTAVASDLSLNAREKYWSKWYGGPISYDIYYCDHGECLTAVVGDVNGADLLNDLEMFDFASPGTVAKEIEKDMAAVKATEKEPLKLVKPEDSVIQYLSDPFLNPKSAPYNMLSARIQDIAIMLEGGALAVEIGYKIGQRHKGISLEGFPPWIGAYNEAEFLFSGLDLGFGKLSIDVGSAAAGAAKGAGASDAEARRLGARAEAWTGGTPAATGKVLSGNALKPDSSAGNPDVKFADSDFTPSLMEDKPPSEYRGMRSSGGDGLCVAVEGTSELVLGISLDDPPSSSSKIRFSLADSKSEQGVDEDIFGDLMKRRRAQQFTSGSLWENHFAPDCETQKWAGGKCTDPRTEDDELWESLNSVLFEKNLNRDVQTRVVPNDPLFAEQKNADTTDASDVAKKGVGFLFGALTKGTISVGGDDDDEVTWQWYMPVIGMKPIGKGSAWDVFDGTRPNVTVAVIDSGLDLKHPDRPKYLWKNPREIPNNGKDDDGNGYVDDIHGWNFLNESPDVQDDYGHGTFVAGIIAAATNNGKGIAGINPGARIMTLKVTGRDSFAKSLNIYRGLRYAVDNGAKVINISLGKNDISHLEQIGINYAWNMGCLVVVAAGNQAGLVSEYGPPGVPRALSVGALDADNEKRGTSNLGRTVVISAPGEGIYSLTSSTGKRDGRIIPMGASEYHTLDGTSFSAPMVAAVASLKWAMDPKLTNRQIANLLMATAKDIGNKGWDVRTGAGLLDAYGVMKGDGNKALGVRITDLIIGRKKGKRKAQWVDLYGVVSGPVKSYTVSVADGRNPSQNSYNQVWGPVPAQVDNNLLCRIPGKLLGSRKWTFRIEAKGMDGNTRTITMGFDKDGKVLK